jgi:hypothetical protein
MQLIEITNELHQTARVDTRTIERTLVNRELED